jgi:hypothetical protein
LCTPDMRARRVITEEERHGVRSAGLSSEIKDMAVGERKEEEKREGSREMWYRRRRSLEIRPRSGHCKLQIPDDLCKLTRVC